MIQRWWTQTSGKPEPIWIVTYRKFCEFRRFRSCALSHVLLCSYVLYLHSFTASNDNFGFLKTGGTMGYPQSSSILSSACPFINHPFFGIPQTPKRMAQVVT